MAAVIDEHRLLSIDAHLLRKFVWVAICWSWMFGLAQSTWAGCDLGHPHKSSMASAANNADGYARSFRVLGQWVYEAGEIKYLAWQPESTCDGPNCSAKKEPSHTLDGMTIPATIRPIGGTAWFCTTAARIDIQTSQSLLLADEKTQPGYPSGFEYPP